MDLHSLHREGETRWVLEPGEGRYVPVVFCATEALLREMDDKVREQAGNVARLPGAAGAVYCMPDAHWGYGFPVGGVAAFDPDEGGVVSAGGVGFDISCGVRMLHTGLSREQVESERESLAEALFQWIPAGVGSRGEISLDDAEMSAMLGRGARWAVERGWGSELDLPFIEEDGCVEGAQPEAVSAQARRRQRREMGTLGSGNHYLEVQRVEEIFDPAAAAAFGLAVGDVKVSIHCGSRGLGHQIGTEYLREMVEAAPQQGIRLPDRELACARLDSELGRRYLGAMRAAINCALANRQIITHLTREAFAEVLPEAAIALIYDVSHNTCKAERHRSGGSERDLFVHRKGATRAFGPGHPDLPPAYRETGQPVFIGGTMGTESWVLAGEPPPGNDAFASACHGAGRRMSRRQATRQWRGGEVIRSLAERGIVIRSPSARGVAEEAPGAYKDVGEVVAAAEQAGLARRVARLEPMVCIKG